jgi:hypothetical protein
VFIYQNLLSRCLTTLAFGVGHGRQKTLPLGKQTGSGVYVFRNLFDFRRPVMYQFPSSPEAPEELPSKGRFASDHGSPAWEPMNIYHNTLIADGAGGYDYGTAGFTGGLRGGNLRRVFNNLVVQLGKFPSTALVRPSADLEIDGNLFWSMANGAADDFLAKFRLSKAFAESKTLREPGLGAHDRFADPKLIKLNGNGKELLDLRLREDSPAFDMGIELPDGWPDPLRRQDAGKPDAGALPKGGRPWHVGARGRLTMFGDEKPLDDLSSIRVLSFAEGSAAVRSDVKPAAIVEGYPEFDAPIIEYALKRHGMPVERRERAWLAAGDYAKYSLVVIAGDLRRAGTEPDRYTKQDLDAVQKFLNDGGTLMLLRRGKRVFDWSPEGREFLQSVTSRQAEIEKDPKMSISQPRHPWVKHLDASRPHPWLAWRPDSDSAPLRVGKGQRIISSPGGTCLLYRAPVGQGQLIYVGWQVADSLPGGRAPSTVEQEKAFEDQVQIFLRMISEPSAKDAP